MGTSENDPGVRNRPAPISSSPRGGLSKASLEFHSMAIILPSNSKILQQTQKYSNNYKKS
jgi:hypothetical protein